MASISNVRAIAQLTSVAAACDAGSGPAVVRVYAGAVPANLDTTPVSPTLLAELVMSDPSFGTPTDGGGFATMAANAIANDASANADGTPTYARVFDSDDNPVLQVSSAVGSGELNFSAAIVSGLQVEITSFVVNQPEI